MKLGVLTTSYPRFAGDVAGHFVEGFARALAARGHELEVLVPEPRRPSQREIHDHVCVNEVAYLRPRAIERTFYGAGVPDNVRRDALAWPGLASFPPALYAHARARVSSWDAIVSHWALPCGLVAGAVRGDRPHLAVLHSADVHWMRRLPLRARWASTLARGATQLLFTSHAMREELLSWLPAPERERLAERAHVSAMGVDPIARVERGAAREKWSVRGFALLALGRLVPIKGIVDLVRAVAGIDELTLLVAGEGPEREAIARAARAHRVEARLLGVVSGADKDALLCAADAMVLPSRPIAGRDEGAPVALIEAAASGLPIIASRVGAVPELFDDQTSALLVPPGDCLALRGAIVRAMSDRALCARLAEHARPIGEQHQWPLLAPRVERWLAR